MNVVLGVLLVVVSHEVWHDCGVVGQSGAQGNADGLAVAVVATNLLTEKKDMGMYSQ